LNISSSEQLHTKPVYNKVMYFARKNTLFMVALGNIYCHYIFALWFLLSSSFFFFSSLNFSRRRFDVCHTSTHGVALVRISDAGLKRAARGSLEIQDAKKSPKIAIWAPLHNFIGLYLRN